MQIFELLLLAALAVVVLARLYMVLGKGGTPERKPAPTQTGDAADGFARKPLPEPVRQGRPLYTGPAAEGLESIALRDSDFDPDFFLSGANKAYEMIVEAFAQGDRETLRPLLTPDVFDSYDQSIRERTGASTLTIDRIKKSEIMSASLDGNIATVSVRFDASLDAGDEHQFVDAKEIWSFEKNVDDNDGNWRLAAVASAS